MKLTNRQLKSVVDLLMKEENENKNIQIQAFKNKRNSLVNETLLAEGEIELSDLPGRLVSDLDDFSVNYSEQQISKLNNVIYKSLADLLERATGESMSWKALSEELEAFDVYEHEMELATDIKAAVDNYIKKIGEATVSMVGSEPDKKEVEPQVEPQYSEYE